MAFVIKIDDRVQRISKLSVTYSNEYFYAFYSIECLSYVKHNSKIELIETSSNKTSILYPINIQFTGKSYIYDCLTGKQKDIIFRRYQPFKQETDLQGILKNYNLKYKFKFNSIKELFIIPECSLKTLLSLLESQIQVIDGSASNYLLDLKGEIYGTDYKISMKEKAKWLNGNVVSDYADNRWYFDIPYDLNVYTSSPWKGIYKDSHKTNNSIKSIAREHYMFTLENTDQKRNIQHDILFNRNYYTSRKIEVTNIVSPIKLGDRVNISNNVDGVVESLTIDIPLNDEETKFKALVVCPF